MPRLPARVVFGAGTVGRLAAEVEKLGVQRAPCDRIGFWSLYYRSGDDDFALRWRLIKAGFAKLLPVTERRSAVRQRRGERGIWQRRYWEHLIRDDADFAAHMDYVHINPVKHRLVKQVADWPYSTFHRRVQEGVYPLNWAGSAAADGLDYDD